VINNRPAASFNSSWTGFVYLSPGDMENAIRNDNCGKPWAMIKEVLPCSSRATPSGGFFGSRVDGGGSFVKDQNLGIRKQVLAKGN
jgi:hypothetical protein